MSKKENIEKYNVLKGVSIYFVICIHIVYKFFTPDSKPLAFEIYNYLTGFAVPFFLILGGFFFSQKFLSKVNFITKKNVIKAVKNIFKRIVIPYYVFVLILTVFNLIIGKHIFVNHFLFIDSNEHGLYFLIIYTYASLFSLFITYLFRDRSKLIIVLSITIFGLLFFLVTNNFKGCFAGSVVFSELPLIAFFCCGTFMYFLYFYFEKRFKLTSTIYLTTFAILIFTLILFFARKIYGPFPVITSAPPTIFRLIYCLLAFWLSLSILSYTTILNISKKIKMDVFGDHSMFIFLIHPYFIKAIVPVVNMICGHFAINYKTNIFIIPVMLVAYIITYLSSETLKILPGKVQIIFSR